MKEKELTDKIREVFDQYEDPRADYGWQELRKKYPENNRIVPIWWWASAATVMLVAGLWLFLPGSSPEISSESNKQAKSQVTSKSSEPEKADLDIPAIKPLPSESVAQYPATEQILAMVTPLRQSGKDIRTTGRDSSNTAVLAAGKRNLSSGNTGNEEPAQASVVAAELQQDSIQSENAWAAAPAPQTTPHTTVPEPASAETANESLIHKQAEALANLDAVASRTTGSETENSSSRKSNSISVYAGSFFNYAEGSETKMNFGAGFVTDFSLDKRFKLTAGLGLAKNNLVYNNGLPENTTTKLQQSAIQNSGPASSNNLTTITRYEASLVNIDIPVNLKYLIIPKSEAMYMSAGLSSGIFLSEAYSLSYKNYSSFAGSYLSQSQGEKVRRQLQGFDFARTLNLSVGFNTALGKSQSLSIEPFLKYPLGGVGSENLRFGTSGLNLKLNFPTKKAND